MTEKGIITMPDHHESFDRGIAALRELGIETVWEKEIIRSSKDPKVVIPQVRDYDYVFAGGEVWNEEVFAACPKLKLLVRLGVGYDAVDLDAATRAGVPVTYMPGVNAQSVAELTVALILSASRRVPQMNEKIHASRRREAIFTTSMLGGKTVAVLGLGNIGKSVAKILRAFGCRILAFDLRRDEAFAAEYGVTYVSLEEALAQADVVSLHLALTPQTKHIIDGAAIASMKTGAILVNTSRGGTVDSEALAEALRSGKLAAAALDVVEDEGGGNPTPGKIFYGLENCILTPHVGGVTYECFDAMMEHACGMVRDFKADRDPKWLLNPGWREGKRS